MAVSSLIAWCVCASLGFTSAMFIQDYPDADAPMMLPTMLVRPPMTRTPRKCLFPPNSGYRHPSFKQYYKRYYFNRTSGNCEAFAYNTNGGNGNNFRTEEDCMGTCYCTSTACFLPKARGECNGNVTSYYYNKKFGGCVSFSYGGCGGNANRFESLDECSQTCTCSSCVLTGGRCRGYHYSTNSKSCLRTRQANCASQPAMFTNRNKCETTCHRSACTMPLDHGTVCAQQYPGTNMLYYDSKSNSCKPFFYEGCDGNQNRFISDDLCMSSCGAGAAAAAADVDVVPNKARPLGLSKISYNLNYPPFL